MPHEFLSVQFRPYVGDSYRAGIMGMKVLVLGESHHHTCSKDDECREETETEKSAYHQGLTCKVIGGWKDHPARSPLSYNLPKIFAIKRFEFWYRVSFYNYVQSFVSAPRQRPSDSAFNNSARAFQEVLDQLVPDRILVLGKKTWQSLPGESDPIPCLTIPEPNVRPAESFSADSTDNGVACWYGCGTGHRALAMPITHPAAPGFRAYDWTESVERWLTFQGQPDDARSQTRCDASLRHDQRVP